MKYLMWDVDGTLVLTGGAGKDAMINVIKDYYFLDAFDFTRSLAGRTDSDIIKSVVTRLRGRCSSCRPFNSLSHGAAQAATPAQGPCAEECGENTGLFC